MAENTRFGKQPPRYTFFLNPYIDARFTKCPKCGRKTGQKKLPLVVHVDEWGLVSLNKTCRYCSHCQLLIAQNEEIETMLTQLFQRSAPRMIGNDYLVIGTLDRSDWKRGMAGRITPEETIQALHDFEDVVSFKFVGGWGPKTGERD